MDACCEYVYSDITINDETAETDRLVLDADGGVTGLDGAPIRAQIDPKGQADGGIVHTKHLGPRIIVFKGFFDIHSVENRQTPEWREAVEQLRSDTLSSLEAQLNSEDDLEWTPAGLSAHSIACTYGIEGGEFRVEGDALDPTWTFTLVAADPAISGA